MLIQSNDGNFDTDQLLAIDRVSVDGNGITNHVIVSLGMYQSTRIMQFKGVAAQQVWAQVTEQANDIAVATEQQIKRHLRSSQGRQ